MKRSKYSSRIEAQAKEVLGAAGIQTAPVPVETVAYRFGLELEPAQLGDDVSGLLVVVNGQGTIGYNSTHPYVRQRFTIAHEIGHYVLHQNEEQLFIDKQYTAVYRRDQTSSTGEQLREIQANHFAAALLMPEALVLKEIEGLDFDLGDEKALTLLATKFQVSAQAMLLRLSHLGFFENINQ